MGSDVPAMMTAALLDNAPRHRQRHAATARQRSQPAAGRYVRRTRVTWGEGGLGLGGMRPLRAGNTSHDGDDQCPGPSALTTELVRIQLPKLPAPIPHGFIGQKDAACGLELFHVAVAQAEAIIEPHAVADDVRRKAVVLTFHRISW